jgi:NAD(P)H-dependent FMN reductase
MITIISGTNRPDSNTRKIAVLIEGIYQKASVPVQLLDLAELPPEIFNPASYAEKPAAFTRFAEAVVHSRGLVIVTPEYNGGPPGVLKYFIDMLPFPESFEARPVCFVGLAAGLWGALRPVEQLQQIFGYRNAFIFPERVFIPGIQNHLSPEGTLKNAEIFERLRSQAKAFTVFTDRLASRVT